MPYKIVGKIQHYAWGGYQFIPHLLHLKNPEHQPFAEYWLGAHDKASSTLTFKEQKAVPLNTLIEKNPETFLGEQTRERFGRLPFLFKVLDVKDMLSIQVHPTKKEAEKGFARENAAGVPLDAPNRNYKDDNHKPEMMVALSEFYLLHGFRAAAPLQQILSETAELKSLSAYFDKNGHEALYSHVMNMPRFRVNELLIPLMKRILPLYKKGKLSKKHPDFWAARAVDSGLSPSHHPDKGIFSIYLFNLVQLQPGEGIFQAAGIPHAYLEGQNVELMANSDNVLRGGLTPKHVDVEELLKHTCFEGITPKILKGQHLRENEWDYGSPVSDFSLSKIAFNSNYSFDSHLDTIRILLIVSGNGSSDCPTLDQINQGDAILLIPGETLNMATKKGMLIYMASVPTGAR